MRSSCFSVLYVNFLATQEKSIIGRPRKASVVLHSQNKQQQHAGCCSVHLLPSASSGAGTCSESHTCFKCKNQMQCFADRAADGRADRAAHNSSNMLHSSSSDTCVTCAHMQCLQQLLEHSLAAAGAAFAILLPSERKAAGVVLCSY